MCILFFAINQHPKYPVIICANRDEFHQRPTQEMHFWNTPKILAGKDLQAGGTWLGLNSQGRFAALTNFRQPSNYDKNRESRGQLVLQALQHSDKQLQTDLPESSSQYNGFNLVYGTLNDLTCFESINQKFVKISEGFHSICNGELDDIWPKMALGTEQLANTIAQSATQKNELNIESLFSLMCNTQQAENSQLPSTGIALDMEQLLSSIFIQSTDYGTRSTTIITQDITGKINVYDRSYSNLGKIKNQQAFTL